MGLIQDQMHCAHCDQDWYFDKIPDISICYIEVEISTK